MVAAGLARVLDAFVPGERDVGDNAAWLQDLARRNHLPVVAANLRTRDGQRPFPPFVLKEAAGVRVLVVGVTDPAVWPAGLSLEATEPAAALRDALRDAPMHDVAILLAHADLDTAGLWAADVGAFAVVAAAHGGNLVFVPRVAEGRTGMARVLVVGGGKGGKYAGRLTVRVVKGERGLRGGADYARTRVAVDNLRRKLAGGEDAQALAQLRELEATVRADEGHSRGDWDLTGLEMALPEDATVASWVAAYLRANPEKDKPPPQGCTAGAADTNPFSSLEGCKE